ncbi:hypothetical protein WN944_002915 [Citrus x changshan-huyou]|uniref:Uncharacterized protein n=1 Tax=Citrus x changshan-huyou TaxID=2935761 RepID=A0AAP0MJX6_9ROSI
MHQPNKNGVFRRWYNVKASTDLAADRGMMKNSQKMTTLYRAAWLSASIVVTRSIRLKNWIYKERELIYFHVRKSRKIRVPERTRSVLEPAFCPNKIPVSISVDGFPTTISSLSVDPHMAATIHPAPVILD